MIGNAPGTIIKTYPQRGPIKQFRFEKIVHLIVSDVQRKKKQN